MKRQSIIAIQIVKDPNMKTPTEYAKIGAKPVRHMVISLMARGWRQLDIAIYSGLTQSTLSNLLAKRQQSTDYLAGKKIEKLYKSNKKPPKMSQRVGGRKGR